MKRQLFYDIGNFSEIPYIIKHFVHAMRSYAHGTKVVRDNKLKRASVCGTLLFLRERGGIKMLETVVPVCLMVVIGMFCRKKKIVSEQGINELKNLLINVLLPVLIFNVMATAEFSMDSILIFITIFLLYSIMFAAGFGVQKIFKSEIKTFVPYVMVCVECGMIGYALLSVLKGADKLYYLATMDLATALFGFTIYVTSLKNLGEGKKQSVKETILDMVKTPTLMAAVLGVIAAVTGLGNGIVTSSLGGLYEKAVEMTTASISPMILICIGYGIHFEKATIKMALKLTVLRGIAFALMFAISYGIIKYFVGMNELLLTSMVIYFILPPTFIISVYTKTKKQTEYISGMLSLYMGITLIGFLICAYL